MSEVAISAGEKLLRNPRPSQNKKQQEVWELNILEQGFEGDPPLGFRARVKERVNMRPLTQDDLQRSGRKKIGREKRLNDEGRSYQNRRAGGPAVLGTFNSMRHG